MFIQGMVSGQVNLFYYSSSSYSSSLSYIPGLPQPGVTEISIHDKRNYGDNVAEVDWAEWEGEKVALMGNFNRILLLIKWGLLLLLLFTCPLA